MAISTNSCLKLTPSSQSSSPFTLTPKPTHVTWPHKERSWRRQWVTGVACILIGLEMANVGVVSQKDALAGDMQIAVESKAKVKRWSDKRACPPWHVNSLENIVPENLPRPSAHRRWEAVGYAHESAPGIKFVTKNGFKCFSL